MSSQLSSVTTRAKFVPQSEAVSPAQVKNSAGGYTFTVDDSARLHRFLCIGTEQPTYYANAKALTKDNAEVVLRFAREDGEELVRRLVEVSQAGRAPKNTPALFALAAAASLGDDAGRKAALDALPLVVRTGTHLFEFVGFAEQFRGWGRGLRRGVSSWYLSKSVDQLAYQMAKYRQREGWSQRDLLRLAHPLTQEADRKEVFEWVCRGTEAPGVPLLMAFDKAQAATTEQEWLSILGTNKLSWEMLPDAALTNAEVWRALIDNGLPQTALMRQLPRLTNLGLFNDSNICNTVVEQLCNVERLRKGRVHPVNVLIAQRTYASGKSVRGSNTWTPHRQIIDGLDAAFYAAFGAVEPANKRTLLALDISGSMGWGETGTGLTPREASAALALVTMATENDTRCVGFSSGQFRTKHRGYGAGIADLPLSPRQRLDDAIKSISDLPFGGTDCALPMIWARENNLEFDTFVVYTDNECWAGDVHPHVALQQYRDASGINARCAVVALTPTQFSIADPADLGMLDVCGLDAAVPVLLNDFSRGDI